MAQPYTFLLPPRALLGKDEAAEPMLTDEEEDDDEDTGCRTRFFDCPDSPEKDVQEAWAAVYDMKEEDDALDARRQGRGTFEITTRHSSSLRPSFLVEGEPLPFEWPITSHIRTRRTALQDARLRNVSIMQSRTNNELHLALSDCTGHFVVLSAYELWILFYTHLHRAAGGLADADGRDVIPDHLRFCMAPLEYNLSALEQVRVHMIATSTGERTLANHNRLKMPTLHIVTPDGTVVHFAPPPSRDNDNDGKPRVVDTRGFMHEFPRDVSRLLCRVL
jgi:hypothetical protein